MANPFAPKKPCQMPDCKELAVGRGLCERHYDQWYGKIRRQRDKLRRRDRPFLRFENPYREGSGYNLIFEVIRNSQPLTTDQVIRRSKIELAKAGRADYSVAYAFEVLRAKRHACKRGGYQMRKDQRGRWHLIRDRGERGTGSDGDNP